jgi:redox-sensitive bicupin YhaK (pirin superfamily)
MRAPWYQDFVAGQIPQFEHAGVKVSVIAGASHGVAGAVQREHTEPLYLDLQLSPGARFEQPLAATHNAFVYVYEGEARVGDGAGARAVPSQRMAILSNEAQSTGVVISAAGAPVRALLIAGQPLNEPIVQYGPFVMNSTEQIHQAVEDFRAGRLA